MKKIFSLITAGIAATILMVSCLGNSEDPNTPIANALIVYDNVRSQSVIAFDPAHIAFRLNTLLVTAEAEGVDPEQVEITLSEGEEGDDDDDDKDPIVMNYIDYLFGKNTTVTETADGIWEVKFANTQGELDYYKRQGSLLVNTHGTYLHNLGTAGWEVNNAAGESTYTINVGNVVFRVGIPDKISIQNNGQGNTWCVTAEGIKASVGSLTPSDWKMDFRLRQNDGRQTYEDMIKSTYYADVDCSGSIMESGMRVRYTSLSDSPLQYRLYCNTTSAIAGTERVELLDHDQMDPVAFPANYMRARWTTSGSSCVPNVTFSYNGQDLNL